VHRAALFLESWTFGTFMALNPEQLEGLAVLALAMVPVAVLWWIWIRMLR